MDNKQKMASMLIKVPFELYTDFKIALLKNNTSIKCVILDFITKYVMENKQCSKK